METELKVGDEGKTDNDYWQRYRIVAKDTDGRPIAEIANATGGTVLHRIYADGRMKSIIKLLPPTPPAKPVQTMRRWLWVFGSDFLDASREETAKLPGSIARPADITYGPDGRIESITFLDEEPAESKTLDLQAGDVVRLRNGDEERIEGTDGISHGHDRPVYGMRHGWWKNGRHTLSGEESFFDIVEVVKRA